MKKICIMILGFLVLAAWPACSKASSGKPEDFQVLKIIDGDTIDILYQGEKERIRLLRIDTPERDEEGYFQAKEALKKLVTGRRIRLEFEIPGKLERGIYGRILAYVWVDNMNVNVEMVRLGCSLFWTKYGEGKYAEEFRNAERKTDKHYPKDILGTLQTPTKNFYVYAYADPARDFSISQHGINIWVFFPPSENPANSAAQTITSTQGTARAAAKNPTMSSATSLEYKLAVINAGGYVPSDHITVARFRNLLQQLSNIFVESKQQIVDMSVKNQELLREDGIEEKLIKIMEGMNQLFVYPLENEEYAFCLTSYGIFRGKGQTHKEALETLTALFRSFGYI